ncbi:MAG: Mur ligase family protein, partial [Caldisericota bacterium]|nr:Mur ligase family protein [Caldisericota bacterium]
MSPLAVALAVCATAATVAIMAVRSRYLLHMFQLEEYDPRRFMRWTFGHCRRLLANVLLDVLAALGILFLALQGPLGIGATAFYAAASIVGGSALILELHLARRSPVKKPFVATVRAKRLLACTLTLVGVVLTGIAVRSWPLALSTSWLLALLAPFVVVTANVVMMPVQLSERRWFLNDARRVLRGVKPVVVGVTGSYGKTSTKVFLEHLLAGRLSALATPESYNTVLGICRVIRDQLRPEHQVFIVELAENEAGGYAGLLGLVPCDLSIVTAVGVQHLEEFGTEENIRAVMRDFVRVERSGQTIVLNNDDAFLQSLAEVPGKRLVRVGIAGNGEPSVRAANVQATSEGLAFDLETPDGARLPCKTAILGRHNVQNILL